MTIAILPSLLMLLESKNLMHTSKTLYVCSTCHAADIKTMFPLMPHTHTPTYLWGWIRWRQRYEVRALADFEVVEVHRQSSICAPIEKSHRRLIQGTSEVSWKRNYLGSQRAQSIFLQVIVLKHCGHQ